MLILKGAQRISLPSLSVRANTLLLQVQGPSAKPAPGHECSSVLHLCWELLGFILTNRPSMLNSAITGTEKSLLFPHLFIFTLSATPAEQEQAPCSCTATPAQTPAGKELLLFPDCADPRVRHQQSCVSTRVFTRIVVLAKKN